MGRKNRKYEAVTANRQFVMGKHTVVEYLIEFIS
jgi:hypothetical protein